MNHAGYTAVEEARFALFSMLSEMLCILNYPHMEAVGSIMQAWSKHNVLHEDQLSMLDQ